MIEDNGRDEDLTCTNRNHWVQKVVSMSFRRNNLKCQKFYKIVCCFLCKMPLILEKKGVFFFFLTYTWEAA